MKILCPNCAEITDCDFELEIYFCKECKEEFAAYEKPAEKELMKLIEIQAHRIENLKMSQGHRDRSQAVKHMLELSAFLRKIMLLGLLRGSPRLRDEALKILDGVENPNITFCPNCECDRETTLYSEVRECTVCREGFEIVCGVEPSDIEGSGQDFNKH